MIAIDTNILVYAHREESPWHAQAVACLRSLGDRRWGLPWPCVHEFIAIVTHPRIFDPPSPMVGALAAAKGWLDSPTVFPLAELEGYVEGLASILEASRITGPRVHEARIATLCLQHGAEELWTADRDFSRFPGLPTKNPLVAESPQR